MRIPVAAALLLLTTVPAGAADLLGKERVELTPFFGYRVGGHFGSVIDERSYPIDGATSYGGLIDVNLQANNFKLEFLWSRQETQIEAPLLSGVSLAQLTVDHFQGGIMQEVGDPKARFSVSVLLGATRLSVPALGSETKFSGSIGGSLKLFPSTHFGIRLDARAYGVLIEGGSAAFCSGGCVVVYSGTALWQGDFTAGLILAF